MGRAYVRVAMGIFGRSNILSQCRKDSQQYLKANRRRDPAQMVRYKSAILHVHELGSYTIPCE